MPEAVRHIPALAGARSGRLGKEDGAPGVTLRALPEGLVVLALGRLDRKAVLAASLRVGLDGCSVSDAGFEQWLIAGDTPASSATLAALAQVLAGKAHVSDQSHGRVRIALSGPRTTEVLAKGCGIDLAGFAVGAGAMTLYGHLGCHLVRVEADVFHLTVLRSFALALWDELVEAGREYGVEAIPS